MIVLLLYGKSAYTFKIVYAWPANTPKSSCSLLVSCTTSDEVAQVIIEPLLNYTWTFFRKPTPQEMDKMTKALVIIA